MAAAKKSAKQQGYGAASAPQQDGIWLERPEEPKDQFEWEGLLTDRIKAYEDFKAELFKKHGSNLDISDPKWVKQLGQESEELNKLCDLLEKRAVGMVHAARPIGKQFDFLYQHQVELIRERFVTANYLEQFMAAAAECTNEENAIAAEQQLVSPGSSRKQILDFAQEIYLAGNDPLTKDAVERELRRQVNLEKFEFEGLQEDRIEAYDNYKKELHASLKTDMDISDIGWTFEVEEEKLDELRKLLKQRAVGLVHVWGPINNARDVVAAQRSKGIVSEELFKKFDHADEVCANEQDAIKAETAFLDPGMKSNHLIVAARKIYDSGCDPLCKDFDFLKDFKFEGLQKDRIEAYKSYKQELHADLKTNVDISDPTWLQQVDEEKLDKLMDLLGKRAVGLVHTWLPLDENRKQAASQFKEGLVTEKVYKAFREADQVCRDESVEIEAEQKLIAPDLAPKDMLKIAQQIYSSGGDPLCEKP